MREGSEKLEGYWSTKPTHTKKYKIEFNLIPDKNLLIPEYKIDLLNKNKKIIRKIENIERMDKNLSKQQFYKSNRNNFKKRDNKKKFYYKSKKIDKFQAVKS